MKNKQTIRPILLIVAVFILTCRIPAFADGNPGLKTVCIDAGHGGKDPGCVSKDRKTYESRIVLDIAKKLSARIKQDYPEVKVVMTRSSLVSYEG